MRGEGGGELIKKHRPHLPSPTSFFFSVFFLTGTETASSLDASGYHVGHSIARPFRTHTGLYWTYQFSELQAHSVLTVVASSQSTWSGSGQFRRNQDCDT